MKDYAPKEECWYPPQCGTGNKLQESGTLLQNSVGEEIKETIMQNKIPPRWLYATKKNIKYNKISTDTDHIGALNDQPFSNPHPDIKNIFSRKWYKSLNWYTNGVLLCEI